MPANPRNYNSLPETSFSKLGFNSAEYNPSLRSLVWPFQGLIPPSSAASGAIPMNSRLQVEKGLSTEIIAIMADWQDIRGHFYLADHAENHYGEETLLDVLNHPGKPFIPFAQEDEAAVVLIQKSRIVGLRPKCIESCEWPQVQADAHENWLPAQMAFAGFSLEGDAYTGDLPPHRRRLADLLNYGQTFFVFKTDECPWIVNKDLLNHLVPLD